MSLYKKLLTIQQKINGLSKDSKSNTYQYVSGSKVLENIKPLMNNLGLILKQEILSIENTRQDYKTGIGTNYEKPKSEILSKVMMRFTWIDCETGEKDENLFGSNGQNDWEKGLGSALTYAERYFLLKYFHIATDEDDIDNQNRKKDDNEQSKPIENKINPIWIKEIESCENINMLETFYKANEAEIKKQKNVLILIKSQKEKLLKDGN